MSKRILTSLYFVVLATAIVGGVFTANEASAANSANWQAGRIIDDAVFTDANAMSVAQIQDFLNQKVGTGGNGKVAGQCDTNGAAASEYGGGSRADYGAAHNNPAPFTCLKDYYEVPKTTPGPGIPANNYGGAPIPAGSRSAAQLIWDAAQANQINPKVLLVTIQKESAGPLTTDDWPFRSQYTYAMGAHCPDSGPGGSANCDPNYAGFSIQISESAALLRYYLDNMNQSWWTYKRLGDNSILYNPNTNCGSSVVNITSRGTAALYTYTPYQPNQAALNNLYGLGDSCSAYGNRNFWRIFTDWFGSTQTNIPYVSMFSSNTIYADSARTIPYSPAPKASVTPGGKAYITLRLRNNGFQTWDQSNVYLGTINPQDRVSSFADTSWKNPSRIPQQETAVLPGDTATFAFSITAPATTGSYQECFNAVAEGVTWMQGAPVCYSIDVVTPEDSNDQTITLTAGQIIHTADYLLSPSARSVLTLQPDGNLVLYSDSVPRWHTNTIGSTATMLIMQTDGNLVLYDSAGKALWASGTVGNNNARLVMQSDGNLVIYSASNAPLWASATYQVPSYSNSVLHTLNGGTLYPQQSLQMADRSHKLIMQRDGNLVLYSGNKPVWASFTQNHPGAFAVLQSDGNLVVYAKNLQPLWATYTKTPGSSLIMQDDGNLVLYSPAGKALWQTQTYGR